MSAEWRELRKLSVLDFDIECRPLSWYGGDWVTKEVTAIGCQFTHEKRGHCFLLGEMTVPEMLVEFRKLYDQADIVSGHYISGFDLPVLAGAMLENDLPPLSQKLTSDTKRDLISFSGLSKSQENLGALLELKAPKVSMNQASWRAANRLTPEGIALTRKRVMGDVRQHIELRQALIARGVLGPPRLWRPDARGSRYSA